MSASDRIKLDWADVTTVNIGSINGVLNRSLDALTLTSNPVLRIQDGSADCGDVIVEARNWSNFWDSPPDGTNDDGDDGDFYFPQEGLYLYKASNGSSGCGASNFYYSSMEANGAMRDPSNGFRYGSSYKAGFEPGDAYTPFSTYVFNFHRNDALDDHLAITDISRWGNTFSFKIWRDYLMDDDHGTKVLANNYRFDEDALARSNVWNMDGAFQFNDGMNVPAGVTFNLAQDAGIRIPVGTSAYAKGTSSAPIRFQSLSGQQWDWIDLQGDGNYFENVVFDGGYKAIEVLSKNNTFKSCRFENGWRGISSGYATSGGRSSFTLDNCIIENNSAVGVVAYHADPTIRYSTIQHNGEAGVWLTDAGAYAFRRNVVENNGTSSSRSGIEVNAGSYLETYQAAGGYNRVKSNTYHEVHLASGASGANLGTYSGGTHNSFFDPNDAIGDAERLIYNGSGVTVSANANYWGSSSAPHASHFYGPVDYSYWIPGDPTFDSGASGVPLMVAEAGQPSLEHADQAQPAAAVSSDEAYLEVNATGSDADRASELRKRMVEIRERLDADPAGVNNARLLRDLFSLQLRDREDVLGEKTANMAAISAARERLVALESTSGLSAKARQAVQESGEAAMLLEIREAMLQEHYATAAQQVKEYGILIQGSDNRRNLLLEQVFLCEREGRFAEALSVFEQFKAIRPEGAVRSDYTPADYRIVEEALREKTAEAGAPKTFLPAFEPAEGNTTLPEGFEVGAAYPNPFNPQTTIRFSLPEAGQVNIQVFDMLGRVVALLADGTYEAGSHQVRFDASDFASGLYLMRVQFTVEGKRAETVTQTLMLMK